MYSFLSKDGSWILTYGDNMDDPEELTLLEFIERYGEDALPGNCFLVEDVIQPKAVTPVNELKDVMHYYESLKRVCNACGEYSRVNGLLMNAMFDTPIEQLIDCDAYEKRRNLISKYEKEVANIELRARACARNFSYWHQRVGYGEISDVDRDYMLSYLKDGDFRKRMNYRINKYSKELKLLSLRVLVQDVFKSFLKQHRLPTPH